MQETENKVPIVLKAASILNYAAAISAVVILWSIFFNPAGSFLEFNSNLHTLFMGSAGSLLFLVYFGAGFFGGGLTLYFVLLALYCLLAISIANGLLKGKRWSRKMQIILSSVFIFFSIISLISSIGTLELSIKVFVLIVNAYILFGMFGKRIKNMFLENNPLLFQTKKIQIILLSIVYVVILSSVLFGFNSKSQSPAELNKQAISSATPEQEMVMTKGMEITAETSEGNIKIVADGDFMRTYSWDDCTRTQTLFPRKERWYGSLGAYFPGPNPSWEFCKGIDGSLLEEGQMHFNTANEAISWINSGSNFDKGSAVYRNDGLLVSFSKSIHPSGKTGILKVNVWQILINNEKPTSLTGGNDSKIEVKIQ